MADDMMDIEDVSFLPAQQDGLRYRGDRILFGNQNILDGENLNRKSVYEPSLLYRCKLLVCSKGRATAIIVAMGIVILIVVLVATLTQKGASSNCEPEVTTVSPIQQTTVSYVATNGEPFPWKDIRLPEDISPLSYDIFLHPNISQRIFSGNVKIKLKILKETDKIILHIKNMKLTSDNDKIQVKLVKSNINLKVVKVLEFVKYNQLYIQVDQNMKIDKEYEMVIKFEAELVKKLSGFYLSSYTSKNGEVRYLGTTQMEPTGAREAFPCFDEPAMKAKFSLTIVREKKYLTLFNTPLKSSDQYENNLMVDTYESSVKMSTYLVAFIVAPNYAYINATTKGNVQVRVYAPDELIDQAKFALQAAVTVMDYYDKLYLIKYPLPKQDLIAIPDFSAGAMENWGLITYRMTSILYDPLGSSSSDQQWVATVVAHELAHQWFGDLVTLKWWNDLWLNEGFASFMEYLGTEQVAEKIGKKWQMNDQFIKDDLQRAMFFDSLKSSHPIDVQVKNPDEINDLFDSISYSKGSSIIRMLRDVMGIEQFNSGITAYLNKYKYGNAVTKDLWNSLSQTKGSSVDVSMIMDTWTKQMGYPVINVKRSGNTITLTQERYLLYPNSTDTGEFTSPFKYTWYVPFSYVTDKDLKSKQLQWMNRTSASFTVPASVKWIKGNYGMFGYYRVNYEESMWHDIIKQLNTDHKVFSSGDRSGLIDDVFQLARAGHLNITIALEMTKYLSKEEDYLPWQSALSNLGYIKTRIQNYDTFDIYKQYVLYLIKPMLNKLGWKNEGDQLTLKLRSLMLEQALEMEDEGTIGKARQLFNVWQNDSKTPQVPANFKDVVFTAGVKYGGVEEWKYIYNKFIGEIVPTEKKRLLRTLGKTTDTTLLNRFLLYSLDSTKVKHQDFSAVISAVSFNPNGELTAWRFVQRNWDTILHWFKDVSFTLNDLIKNTLSRFSNQFDYDEVKYFFEHHDAGPGHRAVASVLEKIQGNVDWMRHNKVDVMKWFDNVKKEMKFT